MLDPPPHGKTYFRDHLESARNYWHKVSEGQVDIDLANSEVYPLEESAAYQLPHDMLYYHPYLETYDETEKLFELSRDALDLADPDVDFSDYTTIILAHAGMGGDFAFALDPTPGNIPSAYLSDTDFSQYGTLETDEGNLSSLLIIPESQNFLQYKETRGLFEDADDPCFYQVGLNGTMALLMGFHLGLPPLFNTETGRSLVGGFALMDQGSNNFHGIVPAYPSPYSRIQAGWIQPEERFIGDSVALHVDDVPLKVSISDTEYYLIENRQRDMRTPAGMLEWIDTLSYDTVSVELGESGVVVSVDEQHAGLPGNGLHIWHIDETARFSADNPNGGPVQLIDFEEADGAQDMGHTTQLIFADYLETGWWFDPWYAANEGWFHLNRREKVVGDSLLNFSPTTYPSTASNAGIASHLRIENISRNDSIMRFNIASDRFVVNDTISSFIGWGDANSLWAFNADSTEILQGILQGHRLTMTPNPLANPVSIFDGSDYSFSFRDSWVIPSLTNGIRIHSINSGHTIAFDDLDSLYEFAAYRMDYEFFAKRGSEYVNVSWRPQFADTSITVLQDEAQSRFIAPDGFEISYGEHDLKGMPTGVRHRDYNPENPVYDGIDVISWSDDESKLKIKHLRDGSERYIPVEKPLHSIPVDVDDNGIYEIALFYQNKIQVINQAGIALNGNPFTVNTFYGNPLVGPMVEGELGIFLRHEHSYSIHSLTGEVVENGVLEEAWVGIENTLRGKDGSIYVLSGHQLLHFNNLESSHQSYWTDPQGNPLGDRTVVMTGIPDESSVPIKSGSVYNYPNPVKGSTTTIRAWLGDVDTWTIEIFSLNGAQVAFVELNVQQINTHNEWVWDASGVSNGLYLAQVIADGKAEIIKIAIIR